MTVILKNQKRASIEAIIIAAHYPNIIKKSVLKSEDINVTQAEKASEYSNEWIIENFSQKCFKIAKCLVHGMAQTSEFAILRKNGVLFRAEFDLSFNYNESYGMLVDEPQNKFIFQVSEKDGAIEDDFNGTEEEEAFVFNLIKQKFNEIDYCFYD